MLNLADALTSHARNIPDREAIVESGTSLGYGALFERVLKIATYFSAKALPPHAIIGVALRDTGLHLSILYGLARAGFVILPMDCRWTAVEKERVARHFGADLVLCENDDALAADIATEVVGDEWLAKVEKLQATRSFHSSGDTPLLLSLSSGTTGRPKGPLIAHKHFSRRFLAHWISLGLNGRQRFMSATPLYFGGGRTFAMSMLFSGGTVIMHPPPYQPRDLIAAIEHSDATSLFLVPTTLRRLLEQNDAALAPLRKLHLLISSGAPLSPVGAARHQTAAVRKLPGVLCLDGRRRHLAACPRGSRAISRIRSGVRYFRLRLKSWTTSARRCRRAPSGFCAIAVRASPRVITGTRKPRARRFATAGFIRVTSPHSMRVVTFFCAAAART